MNEEIADTTLIKNKFNSEDDAVLHAKIKNIICIKSCGKSLVGLAFPKSSGYSL